MKLTKTIFVAAGVGIASLFASIAAQAVPQSYPMICRGGNYSFWYKPGGDTLGFWFTRGNRAASSGVDPGTCAWTDRAVGAGEPNSICHNNAGVNFLTIRANGAPLMNANLATVNYYNALLNSNRTTIFQVYNNGSGCMIVTRIGP